MKKFLINLIAILFFIFIFAVLIITCINVESGHFEVVPKCSLIIFLSLLLVICIARYNDRKEKDKKRKRKNELYREKIKQMKEAELLANQNAVMKFATSESPDFKSTNTTESRVDKSQQDFLKEANIAILAYQALHKNTSHN